MFLKNSDLTKQSHENSSHSVAKLSTWNMGANGFRISLSFITTVLITRWLGAEGFGEVSLVISYLSILYYLFAVGFDSSLSYFVPRFLASDDWWKCKKILKVALLSSLCLSAVVLFIITIFLPGILEHYNNQHLLIPSLVFAYQMEIGSLAYIYIGFMRGLKLFKFTILTEQLVIPLSSLLGMFIFIKWQNLGVLGYSLGHGFSYIFALLFISYTTFKFGKMNLEKKFVINNKIQNRVSNHEIKSWLKFSLPLGVTSSLEPLLIWTSIIIAGWFLELAEVGKLAVCLRITFFARFFHIALGPIFGPYLAEHFKKGESAEFKNLYQSVIGWCTNWALIFSFVLILAPDFLLGLFGKDFVGIEWILIVTLVGSSIEGSFGAIRDALIMAGKYKINLLNLLFAFILNFSLAYNLVPLWGLMGVALSFGITFVLLNFLRVIQFHYLFKIVPMKLSHLKSVIPLFLINLFLVPCYYWLQNMEYLRIGIATLMFLAAIILVFWKEKKYFINKI